jgi:hypothetical protein
MDIPDRERLYRCTACNSPVTIKDIDGGGCLCGGRRVQITTVVSDEERIALEGRGFVFDDKYWVDQETAEQERRLEQAV